MTSIYKRIAQKNIEDDRLQDSLKDLQNRFGKGILRFWQTNSKKNKLRDKVKAAREKNLDHLDILLQRLAREVEQRGGKVFFAENAKEAREYVINLALKNNVKMAVKGKSMVSAEIELDPALKAAGIEFWETDLGEYIVQLNEDQPSHIIAPSIHMTKEQVGHLFEKKMSIAYSNDPPTLTMAARKALREKFLKADMGITGCNLAIASTGQISLISNEGNIRMSTTLPPLHVAIMGMERIVATMAEHKDVVQLLTRGAAMQKISTYVSLVGNTATENSPDGPEEFHLVVLDNGRSKILGDPNFREILGCIRCGACLNVCPVYGKIGGHAYNKAVYSGPIGAVITPLLDGINKHSDLCKGETLCGACLEACPVKNDIPRMLLKLREKLAYSDESWHVSQHKPFEGALFACMGFIQANPFLWRLGLFFAKHAMRNKSKKNGIITSIFGIGSEWTKYKDLPSIGGKKGKTFTEIWNKKV